MRQPEDIKREFVREWLRKGTSDLAAAKHLLDGGATLAYSATFHSQQAVEKLLKAVLVWHQVEFPKTHDIGHLLALVRTIEVDLANEIRDAVALTPYGVEVRYPSDQPEPTQEQAREAVKTAARVHQAVLQHLPSTFATS